MGGPLLLVVLQKGARIASFCETAPDTTLLARVQLLVPDLLFAMGLGALGWAALAGPRGKVVQVAALGVAQLLLAAVLFASTASHRYFLATGTPLDYPLFWLGLVEIGERARVATSEIPASTWLLQALALFTSLVMPWHAVRGCSARPGPRGRHLATGIVGGLCALTASAWVPPPAGVGSDFARPAVAQLLMTARPGNAVSAALLSEARAAPRGARALTPTEEAAPGARRNVLFLVLESTSATATTPYAPQQTTTPALARWATRGTLVESAYAVVPHTSKALVAILCGFPPRVGVRVSEAVPNGIPGRCLPALLRDQGYATAFMQSARGSFESRGDLVAALGFESFQHSGNLPTAGFQEANYFAHEDDILRAPARAFVAASRARQQPFVLTLLTGATHHDYREVRRYGTQTHDPHNPVRNRWLNAVRRQDHLVDDVLHDLTELGVLDETLVMVVGDHGEAFGEHGLRTHDEVPYNEVLHVPLLLLDGRAPGRVRGPVTQLDLVPTVLDRLGYEAVGGRYPGLVITPDMPEDRRIYAACYHELRCAVEIEGRRKRIHRYGVLPDQLFDLEEDPHEERDLVALSAADSEAATEAARATARSRRWVQVTTLMSQATDGVQRAIDEARVQALPADAVAVTGRFGDVIRVLGVQHPTTPTPRGGFVRFTVFYQVLDAVPPHMRLVQFGRSSGPHVQRYTHTPVAGLYPAALWQPGEIIADTFSLRVPANHPDDYMDVSVGFRAEDGGEHLPVSEGETRHPGELFVASVPIRR
ncbi:MAG: LTA synthase family protein [Myxococcales bacterium]|nr:LTA synthase family protein [Myxococcales bacterium]